jgi:hypothetical protein
MHGPSGLKFLPFGKARAIADCLENQFASHDLGEEQALSEAVDDSPEIPLN